MPRYSLIVFDLDGTLVDSRRDIADAANALLVERGAAPLSEETIGRMVGDGAGRLVARAFAAAGLAEPPDALDRFLDLYDARLLVHTCAYEGIADVLSALAPHVPLAVLTNKPREAAGRVLEGVGLARFFPASRVLGGDGPLPRKPDPAGLRHLAADAAATPETTVLVGDSVVDWRTAREAGSAVCLARYGFGFDTFPRETLDGRECAVDSPRELLGVL